MAKQELAEVHSNLPAEYIDFGEDAGRGLEGANRNELLTPFLASLHYQCPQIAEGEDAYVDGARPGMLFNTATRQLSNGKEGVEIVPVHREHMFGEWVPRTDGGGFRGVRSPSDHDVQRYLADQGRFNRLTTDDGNELVEQFNVYLLYAPDGEPITADNAQEAVLAFTSTKIQAYKGFFTLANAIRYQTKNGPVAPPLWAHRWRLRTVAKKNDKGSFFVYDLQLVDPKPVVTQPVNSLVPMTSALYQRAKAFGDMLRQGTVTADYAQAAAAEAGDSEIPF